MINQTIEWRDAFEDSPDAYWDELVIASDLHSSHACYIWVDEDERVVVCFNEFEVEIEGFIPVAWAPIPVAKEE